MDTAHARAREGRYADALHAYDAVLAADATTEHRRLGHHNRAVALCKLGRKGEALIAAVLAVEADSRNIKSLHNVGVLLGDLGEYAEAAAVFLECARLAVGDEGARLQYALARATCLLEMQQFAECEAMLDQAAAAATLVDEGEPPAGASVGLLRMECRRRTALVGRHRARTRRSDTTRPLVSSVFASQGAEDAAHFAAWLLAARRRADDDVPAAPPALLSVEVPPAEAIPATSPKSNAHRLRAMAVQSSVAAASPQWWSPARGHACAPMPSFQAVRRSYQPPARVAPPARTESNGGGSSVSGCGVAPHALVAALCAPRQASPAPRPAVSVSLRSSISSGV